MITLKSSLICISLNWLSQVEKGENITETCSVENLLTCPSEAKINGVTLQSGRIPNSITLGIVSKRLSISFHKAFIGPFYILKENVAFYL